MKKLKKSVKRKVNSGKFLQTVVQLGNFLIKKKGDGEFCYVRVSTVDGAWGMEFREETMKYAWILMLTSEERYHGILEAWLTLSYHMAMCNPDPEFLDNVVKEFMALGERAEAYVADNKDGIGGEG